MRGMLYTSPRPTSDKTPSLLGDHQNGRPSNGSQSKNPRQKQMTNSLSLGECIDRVHGLHMFGHIGYTMRHRVFVEENDHAMED